MKKQKLSVIVVALVLCLIAGTVIGCTFDNGNNSNAITKKEGTDESVKDMNTDDTSNNDSTNKDEVVAQRPLSEDYNDDHYLDALNPLYIAAVGGLSSVPGDGTFMSTKSMEVAEASNEYMQMYAQNKSSLPPLVYYVIHDIGLTREEVEYYYKIADVSSELIDALFCEDELEAKKLLKHPYAFMIGENIYNIYELMEMNKKSNVSDELKAYMSSDECKATMQNIKNYLAKKGDTCSKEIKDFVNTYAD